MIFVMKKNENDLLEPFYIVDISRIVRQYQQWISHLPRVKPFYAVKCNGQIPLIKTVKYLGCGFDCASISEINSIMNLEGVNRDFLENNIIFANPCKQISHIKYAKKVGVKMTTFDNEDELMKIKEYWPEAELFLRICVDDSKSVCQFSSKYGVKVEDVEDLIKIAKSLELNLVGVSFHVGSGCYDVDSFISALKDSKHVFEVAKTYGYNFTTLDIGGGFPGSLDAKPSFTDIADSIKDLIDNLFPKEIKIIAEPGRFFAAGCYTLVSNIFGKRKVFNQKMVEKKKQKQEYLYYINDGIYQSFNCLFFDHAKITSDNIKPVILKKK